MNLKCISGEIGHQQSVRGVSVRLGRWSAAQTARFLTAISDEPLYTCYQLMAVTGLRRGGAVGCAGLTSTSTTGPSPSAGISSTRARFA